MYIICLLYIQILEGYHMYIIFCKYSTDIEIVYILHTLIIYTVHTLNKYYLYINNMSNTKINILWMVPESYTFRDPLDGIREGQGT